jgi:hypothetical protein
MKSPRVSCIPGPAAFRAALLAAGIMAVLAVPTARAAAPAPQAAAVPAGSNGPTLRLDYDPGGSGGNPVAAFMYFVPLISPDPVTCETSRGSTQAARVTSAKRKADADSFSTRCEFEFSGKGSQQSNFDLTNHVRRHEQKLKKGGALERQLVSITVEGPGSGVVEIEGVVTNGVQTVTEVRLRFNARGKASPVSIGLCDVVFKDGKFQRVNEIVARVNTLTFRRQPGRPKMEVALASITDKGASKGIWQSIKGGMMGMAANLLIPPLTVEATGHRTMLDFGRALTAGETSFTFPRAKNLRDTVGSIPAGGR